MTTALLLSHPPGYTAERRYAYDVIMSEYLGLAVDYVVQDRCDVEIRSVDAASPARVRVADVLFSTPPDAWLTEASLPRRPLVRACDEILRGLCPKIPELPLPVLYSDHELISVKESEWRLGIDVFGASFFLLTRYEELVASNRDVHDRFAAAGSLAGEERLLDRPLVNDYVELLWAVISRLWPRLERRRRQTTLRLSHDVDLPLCRIPLTEARRLALRDVRRERAPAVAGRRVATAALRGSVPPRLDLYQTFRFLMHESEVLGIRSAFFFVGGNTAGAIDGNYRLDERWLRELLRDIHHRGHEIGLHPSYNTYRDAGAVRREFDALRAACAAAGVDQSAFGGRQHYLRWSNPVTWQNWEDAGLAYDSTLAFADHAGFRAGTCYEYPVFNLQTRSRLRLRERPLIVMEASLLEYQRMPLGAAADEVIRLGGIVKRYNGELTLLWHNDRLLSRLARRSYRRAIRVCAADADAQPR